MYWLLHFLAFCWINLTSKWSSVQLDDEGFDRLQKPLISDKYLIRLARDWIFIRVFKIQHHGSEEAGVDTPATRSRPLLFQFCLVNSRSQLTQNWPKTRKESETRLNRWSTEAFQQPGAISNRVLACCRRWVSDSSVCQEIVLSTLPTHFGPRGRCLQCLGLLDQLFLRQVLSWLLLTLQDRPVSGRLLTS